MLLQDEVTLSHRCRVVALPSDPKRKPSYPVFLPPPLHPFADLRQVVRLIIFLPVARAFLPATFRLFPSLLIHAAIKRSCYKLPNRLSLSSYCHELRALSVFCLKGS